LIGDRLKATLERLQRLTQGYADAMIQIFPGRASKLGNALGLEEERITVSAFSLLKTPQRPGIISVIQNTTMSGPSLWSTRVTSLDALLALLLIFDSSYLPVLLHLPACTSETAKLPRSSFLAAIAVYAECPKHKRPLDLWHPYLKWL